MLNIYDFDGTIYDGSSVIDFLFFCIKKNKKCLLGIPKIIWNSILYIFKIKDNTEVKESCFYYLKYISNIDELIEKFWSLHKTKIKKFYLEKEHSNDIIISATPEFLLEPICKELQVKKLIGSIADIKTGKFLSLNCKGKEKVRRLFEVYPNAKILDAYSDSYSDKPFLNLAQNAYLVRKNKIKKL